MSSSYDSAVVDTAMIEDAALLSLPRGIRHMHIEALVWSKLRHTDGLIPRAALTRFTDEPNAEQAAEEFMRVGLWEATDLGWQIVGFTDTQMSAKRVKEKRESARRRYDEWQKSQSDKRVSSRVTNGAARPPARKGRRVDQAPSAAASGAAPGAACSECLAPLEDESGFGTTSKPLCLDCAP